MQFIEAASQAAYAHSGTTTSACIMHQLQLEDSKAHLFNHRVEGFVLEDVPKYNDITFKAHFRMERTTIEKLIQDLGPEMSSKFVDKETKILSTIWLLANEESYRCVADRFNLSKGTLHFIATEICNLLARKVRSHVFWPDVGFIDGCHIPIKGRSSQRDSFINRIGFSTILVQGVCDANLSFIHTYVGWPGSVHDARVYRNSGLEPFLATIPDFMHLLGDSAYPLQIKLITPYRDTGNLTNMQKKFNAIHSAAISSIERSFALLKGKFRRLKYLDMLKDQEIPVTVTACLVLHNYILRNEKGIVTVAGTSRPSRRSNYSSQRKASSKRDSLAALL